MLRTRTFLSLGTKGLVVGLGVAMGVASVAAWTGPAGTAPNSNVSAPLNVSGTAQTKTGQLWANGQLYLNNGSPTVYFVDTDGRSAMIHNNSNVLYFLRGAGNGSTSWTAYNGVWPLTLNLETNAAAFGGAISAASLTTSGNIDSAATVYGARFYTDNATYLPHTNGYNYLRGHTFFNGVLYDENNSGYYLDPAGTSVFNAMTVTTMNVPYGLTVNGYVDVFGTLSGSTLGADNQILFVSPPSGNGNFICWDNTTKKLKQQSANCATSDARLKEHIEPIQAGLAEILKLNPVTFEWKDKKINGAGPKMGLVAQEVKEVLPEIVTGTGTGVEGDWYGVDYNALAAPMIKAIQELKAENDELRAELKELRELVENK